MSGRPGGQAGHLSSIAARVSPFRQGFAIATCAAAHWPTSEPDTRMRTHTGQRSATSASSSGPELGFPSIARSVTTAATLPACWSSSASPSAGPAASAHELPPHQGLIVHHEHDGPLHVPYRMDRLLFCSIQGAWPPCGRSDLGELFAPAGPWQRLRAGRPAATTTPSTRTSPTTRGPRAPARSHRRPGRR